MNDIHPCISRAIALTLRAVRFRKLSEHSCDEGRTLEFEARAAAFSAAARLALRQMPLR